MNPKMRERLSARQRAELGIDEEITLEEVVETKIKDDAKPTIKTPPGSRLFNKPLEDATTIANRISERTGIDYEEAKRITKLDVPRAIKIAQAFEALESDPNNPEVQEAYQALIDETIEQYNAIIEACLLYTSPSPRDRTRSRMPSSA